jgi:hypothetical protein
MEETVMSLMGLVTGTMHWGIENALPLAVGALLGSSMAKAALGLVGDMLGRAKGLLEDVASMLAGKK